MKGPNARIVGLDLQNDMPAWPQHLGIAALWVLGIDDRRAVPSTVAFAEDLEIMSVHVKWLQHEGIKSRVFFFRWELGTYVRNVCCSGLLVLHDESNCRV